MPPPPPGPPPSGPGLVIILVAVVGGILLIGLGIGIFLVLRRSSRKTAKAQPPPTRFGHKRIISDASAVSLLHPRMHWKGTEDAYTQKDYPDTSFDHMQERNGSTDSVATVKPLHDEKFSVPTTDTTPFISETRRSPHHSPKRDLPPLTIPQATSHVPSHPSQPDSPSASAPSPAGSDSSDSLYSQASARSRISTFLPQPMPPMISQYNHVVKESAPARSDTIVVAKLLKERAKRNPNKISRSVSRIERVGSIKDVVDADVDVSDAEDGAEQQPRLVHPRRTKSTRRNAAPLVPMGSLAEGSESGGSPPSSSRGLATVAAPALPPVTLLNAGWVDKESPASRPHSLLPSRTSSPPQIQHQHSRSLDGHPPARDQGTSPGWYAHPPREPALPKAHVRQYSAERALDVTHSAWRKVSSHGLLEGF